MRVSAGVWRLAARDPGSTATFPVLRGTPAEYQAALGQAPTQVFPISPGDKLTF